MTPRERYRRDKARYRNIYTKRTEQRWMQVGRALVMYVGRYVAWVHPPCSLVVDGGRDNVMIEPS